MNFFDYTLIFLVGLSMVISLWRGFVREAISIVGLVLAFIVANSACTEVGKQLNDWIPNLLLATVVGYVLMFVIVMVIIGLIGTLVCKLVDIAELTTTDRTLGMFFGFARGILLISLATLIYTSYTEPDKPWIENSALAPYAIKGGDLLGQMIPEGVYFSRRGAVKPPPKIPTMSDIADVADKLSDQDREALTDVIEEQMK